MKGKTMEMLDILEKRVLDLVALLNRFKQENENLSSENSSLRRQLEELQLCAMEGKQEVDQERELTRMMVDGIIKNIDSVVEDGSHS